MPETTVIYRSSDESVEIIVYEGGMALDFINGHTELTQTAWVELEGLRVLLDDFLDQNLP